MARTKKSTRGSSRGRSRSARKTPIVSPSTLRSIVAVVLIAAGAISSGSEAVSTISGVVDT